MLIDGELLRELRPVIYIKPDTINSRKSHIPTTAPLRPTPAMRVPNKQNHHRNPHPTLSHNHQSHSCKTQRLQ